MTEVYDLAAIGAGPAGDSAQEPPPFYGHRSVVIETNRPGGTLTTTRGAPTIMLCPGVCDSDTILAPKDILIVGCGPVGVEYATICRALGEHVTLLADRLTPAMDGEMSRRMDHLFHMCGSAVVLGATADTITRTAPRILEIVLTPARNSISDGTESRTCVPRIENGTDAP